MSAGPVYSLRGIHYSAALSQETHAYVATLCADGRPIATVENNGHGGQTFVLARPDCRDAVDAAAAWAATLPGNDFEPLPSWCDNQVTAWLARKAFRAELRSRALVLVEGRVRAYHYTGQRRVTPALLENVRLRHPGCPILNTMPEAEAWELWRADAAAAGAL